MDVGTKARFPGVQASAIDRGAHTALMNAKVWCVVCWGQVRPEVQCVVWCGGTHEWIVEAGAGIGTTGMTRWWR